MATEFIDRFDLAPSRLPAVTAEQAPPVQAPPQASPQATPQFIDRFDQPSQAGAAVVLPPRNPLETAQAPPLVIPPPRREPAWPPSIDRPLGPRGSVPLNRNDPAGDAFGGHADFLTTLKASMVPETDDANIRKKFRILSEGMGIPEDRFFMDDAGNIRWADVNGQSHLVAPTIGGGSVGSPQASLDLLGRVGNQMGANLGASIGPTVGGLAGMVTGPLGAAAVAGAVDAGRQVVGNMIAGENNPTENLSYSNMAWQALGTGAVELAGQIGSALITRFLQPGNPYNLRDGEIKQLQGMMDKARSRAGTADKLGMHATPYDLTDLEFLRRLEQTVSKQPGYAGDIMKAYYDQRADFNFPNAVGRLFERISPQGTPIVGLDKLRRGAEETVAHLRNSQVSTGTRGGWGDAIASGARPDVRAAVAEMEDRIRHSSGPVREHLQRLLADLKDGPTLVTDFEKLHNVRLDMEATLDGYRRSLPVEQRGRLTEVLGPIFTKFSAALEGAHPSYAAGTRAYIEAGRAAETVRDGVLTLLAQDPGIAGNLGKTLFKADAGAVEEARKLFIAAGQGEAWDAGTRAVLQDSLSAGRNVSGNFAKQVAPFDANRRALGAALPEPVRADMGNVLDIGRAQGRVVHPANRAEVESVRLEDRQMGGAPLSETVRAALSPFRFMRDLGDELVHRAYNSNAVDMAHRLTGDVVPIGSPFSGAGGGTRDVLRNLEETTRHPFQGWQRHLFERAVNLGGTAATRGLLSQPDPTEPTAEDLQRGLLNMR